jgi:hypothetical protein
VTKAYSQPRLLTCRWMFRREEEFGFNICECLVFLVVKKRASALVVHILFCTAPVSFLFDNRRGAYRAVCACVCARACVGCVGVWGVCVCVCGGGGGTIAHL